MSLTFDLPDASVSLDEIERRLGEQGDRQRASMRRQIREQLGKRSAGSNSRVPATDTDKNADSQVLNPASVQGRRTDQRR